MSVSDFDTEFSFDTIINNTTKQLNCRQLNLDNLDLHIADWTAIVGFNDIKTAKLNSLAITKNQTNMAIEKNQATLDTINTIKSLNNDNKDILYRFYGYSCLYKDFYVSTLINHYSEMLVDGDIINLLADTENDNNKKMIIGDYIVNNRYKLNQS